MKKKELKSKIASGTVVPRRILPELTPLTARLRPLQRTGAGGTVELSPAEVDTILGSFVALSECQRKISRKGRGGRRKGENPPDSDAVRSARKRDKKRTQPAPVLDTMIALNAETEHTEAELRESLTEHGFDPEKLDTGLLRHAVQILTDPHGPNCYCHECAPMADRSPDVETEEAE